MDENLLACAKCIIPVAAVVIAWLRIEKRLSKIEGRVQERYRDRKEVTDRLSAVEQWLPKKAHTHNEHVAHQTSDDK